MGNICAKNDAGKLATDAPVRKPEAKQLASGGPTAPYKEKRWISAGKKFETEDKDAEAKEAAEAYCNNNSEWKFTTKWKNVTEGEAEVSFFEVEKLDPAEVEQKNKLLEAVAAKVQNDVKTGMEEAKGEEENP